MSPSHSVRVRIWWDSGIQAYRITAPYHSGFVDTIKILVPASDRAYDPSTKIWTFTERFLGPIQSLAEKFWAKSEIAVITKAQTQQASAPPAIAKQSMESVTLEFFKVLPYEAAQKAYRHAAMILHPDRGGDTTKMSALNALWNRIKDDVYGDK